MNNRKWMMSFFLFVILTGCSQINGEDEFTKKVKSIEEAIAISDWKQLETLGNELNQLYHDNQWKIQLMGDEDEYESFQESINHLTVAIEDKDVIETKLEVATIKTYLEDIYSL